MKVFNVVCVAFLCLFFTDGLFAKNLTKTHSPTFSALRAASANKVPICYVNKPISSKQILNEITKDDKNGSIILTIPGISPESLWSYVLGTKSIDENQQTNTRLVNEDEAWLKEYFGFDNTADFQTFKNEILAESKKATRGDEDKYLEFTFYSMQDFSKKNIQAETYIWSRNAKDSAIAVEGLIARITELSQKAKLENKALHIVAHSWGSLLSHTALHRLSRTDSNIKIDNFITAGSPLIPSNAIVGRFVKKMVKKGGLEQQVSKPINVKNWVNVWGKRDMISNFIPQSTCNRQTDLEADTYEDKIDLLKKNGIADWGRMRNPISWHSAYYNDFTTYLKSLGINVNIPIFRPLIWSEFSK